MMANQLVYLIIALAIQRVQSEGKCGNWEFPDPPLCVAHHCLYDIFSPCYTASPEENCITPDVDIDIDITRLLANGKTRKLSAVPYFDRRDGSYGWRVQASMISPRMEITVTVRDKSTSAVLFTKTTEQAVCDKTCDNPRDWDTWAEQARCSEPPNQITDDLANFPLITEEYMDKVESVPYSACFVHYSVIDNKVYWKTHGTHSLCGFRTFAHHQILMLTRVVKIPDVEFYVNLSDYPAVHNRYRKAPYDGCPILSWCGSQDSKDIVFPTWVSSQYLMAASTEDIVKMDYASAQAGTWEEKETKLFWRGRDANKERLALVRLSNANQEDIDAGITNWFFFTERQGKKEQAELGSVPRVLMTDFYKYKYLLNVDGTVAAYRFAALMAGNSVIFKQESPYYEHFYNDLEPWKHYIPVKRDLSDLLERITWAREHDEEAKQIAQNGRRYIRHHMRPQDMLCYFGQLLRQYSKNMNFKPRIIEGMELLLNTTHYPKPAQSCTC